MSTAKAQHIERLIRSENKRGRSNRRHFARQNTRKKTSAWYEKKPRKLILSRFTSDGWLPTPSGYTKAQGWGALSKAWLGYKIANNPKNGESFQDRLGWAIAIQNIQTDLRLQRSAFPTVGLCGDYIFAYSESKQFELEDLDNESYFKELRKKKRAHIQEIVQSSMLSEQEKDWLEEYASQSNADTPYDNENKYVEHIIMPNFFDVRRNYHN